MQDRLRLKLNPPNVAVPTGARDLYFNVDGDLVRETPDGTKTVVGNTTVLEFEGSDPNDSSIHLTVGVSFDDDLPQISDVNGFSAWGNGSWYVSNDGAGSWVVRGPLLSGFSATKVSSATTPAGLTGWTLIGGSDQPSITGGEALTGTFVGQRCLASSGFWSWTGTAWLKDSN